MARLVFIVDCLFKSSSPSLMYAEAYYTTINNHYVCVAVKILVVTTLQQTKQYRVQ